LVLAVARWSACSRTCGNPFPGYAQYTPAAKARSGRILAPAQITAWILGNFANVEEVKANINSVDLTPQVLDLLGIVPDLHIKVQDASGRSIVIEPRAGRLVVHDNPTRVLTNAPHSIGRSPISTTM